jgi:hypothetical protein
MSDTVFLHCVKCGEMVKVELIVTCPSPSCGNKSSDCVDEQANTKKVKMTGNQGHMDCEG